jgi:hypothetical protein
MPSVSASDKVNKPGGVSAADMIWTDAFFDHYEDERLKAEKNIAEFMKN